MTIIQQTPATTDQIRPIQFLAIGNQPHVPAPLIRVSTCGRLTIEIVEEIVSTDPPRARYVSLTPEQLRGRGTAPALLLLKLFFNRHERFTLKDWLMEQFCRDGELFSTMRLDNIVSLLRRLLCPPDYQDLRTQLVAHVRGGSSGSDGYQLALFPLIWVDSEALAWNVEQAARMERFGDEACTVRIGKTDRSANHLRFLEQPGMTSTGKPHVREALSRSVARWYQPN